MGRGHSQAQRRNLTAIESAICYYGRYAPQAKTRLSCFSKYTRLGSIFFDTGLKNLMSCQPLPCFCANSIRSLTMYLPSGSRRSIKSLPINRGLICARGTPCKVYTVTYKSRSTKVPGDRENSDTDFSFPCLS